MPKHKTRTPGRVTLALRISSSVLVLSAYMALASVREYSALLLVIPVVTLLLSPWAERLHARHEQGYQALSRAASLACLCFLPLLILTFGLLNGVVALVMYIQVYLLLHQKDERSYGYIFLMGFFLLLAASVKTPEPVVGIVMLFFLLSACWALWAVRAWTELNHTGENGRADIVPIGAAYRPGSSRRRNLVDVGLLFTVGTVSLLVVGLTALLFQVTPRIEAGAFGARNQVTSTTDVTQTVDLSGGGFVQSDPTPVMQVRFPDQPNGRFGGPLYWRTTTMPEFSGTQWNRRRLAQHYEPEIGSFHQRGIFHRVSSTATRRPRQGQEVVRQSFYVEDVPETGMPVLDLVQRVEVTDQMESTDVVWDSYRDFTVRISKDGSQQATYDAWSEVQEPAPEALRNAPQDYSDMKGRDRAILTYEELLPRTEELARDITADVDNVYEKAVAIENYLSTPQYLYTLDVPPLPPQNAIDTFIHDVKRGHCELYASAMALMLRSLGVPTRVVSGYRGGEWNEGDQAYIIRKSMAHLWVEVYFPDAGWVRFDPAPRSSNPDLSGLQMVTRSVSNLQLRLKIFWYQQVIGFDRGIQLERFRNLALGLFRALPFGDDDPAEEGEEGAGSVRQVRVPVFTVLGVTAAGGLLTYYLLRGRRGRWRPGLNPDQKRAVALYRRLRKKLERAGHSCRGLTAEELLRRVRAEGLEDAETAEELLALYNEVRFGGRTLEPSRFTRCKNALARMRFRAG